MPSPAFVHLRLHSEYSIADGMVRLDEAIARSAADGMPALALTDLANLFGMVKFYSGARGNGLKPIIGCDAWVEPAAGAGDRDRPARLLLLVKNRDGYLRLCELLTQAYLGPRSRGRAEISRAAFAAGDNAGLIALSGAALGDVGQALLMGGTAQAEAAALEWARLFPDSYYLELQRYDQPQAEQLIAASTLRPAFAGSLQAWL